MVWHQPSIERVNLIINGLPLFNSPLLSLFFSSWLLSPQPLTSYLDWVSPVALPSASRTLSQRQKKKQSSDSSHGRKICWWSHNPSSFSYLATQPWRGPCCTTSSVICFQSLIKNGRMGLGRRGEEATGDSCLNGHCHQDHLQINKWNWNQWESAVHIICGGKWCSLEGIMNATPK